MRLLASVLVLAVTAAASGCSPMVANPQAPARPSGGDWLQARTIPQEILAGLEPGHTPQQVKALARKLGLQVLRTVPELGLLVLRTTEDEATAIARLKTTPGVRWATQNAVEQIAPVVRAPEPRAATAARSTRDPMVEKQWGFTKANVQAAWAVTRGKPETVVAIVDTGIDYNHPDLTGRVVKGRDFANKDDDPMDGHAHGTHCAGIAGATADNGVGIAGVAPGVTLMAVKVLSDSGSGSTDAVCGGIAWAADHGAHVISLSLGGTGGKEAKQAAVDYARSKGAVVVAAMGNNGQNLQVYPGASKGVIGVGATTVDDTRASFSNFGDWIAVGAPGHAILSTVLNGDYASYSGTSMATPHVAGLAGLVRSAEPTLTPDQVAARIVAGAQDLGNPGFDPQFGHGRIDAGKTLAPTRR